MRLRPEDIEKNVPENLRREPLAVLVERQNQDISTVAKCLELYITRLHNQRLGHEDIRKIYSTEMPGTRALSWLLSSGNCEYVDPRVNGGLLRAIAYCMVAEDKLHFLWDWTRLDRSSWSTDTNLGSQWKAKLLRNVVRAQVHWSLSPDYTTEALSTMT